MIDLANGLAERGHQIYAALRPNSPLISELTRLPHENVFTLPLRNALDPLSARKLARFVRRNEFDIVHAHMARDYPLASYAARRNRARLIITRHVLFPLNRLHTITLSHVARVIAVSEAVARGLREQGLMPNERIVVVHNGIDARRFAAARDKFDRKNYLQQWQIEEDRLLIGTVGELTPLKGHEDFLRAAAIVDRQFANAEFLIAGVDASPTNEHRAALDALIAKLELNDRVRLVGWVEDLPQFYCALDVFVSASLTESFGLAITEAMASKTPVVATKTEGALEIVEDGVTGLLVEKGSAEAIADGIQTALKDRNGARSMSARAQQEIAKRFSVERMVSETLNVYRDALSLKSADP